MMASFLDSSEVVLITNVYAHVDYVEMVGLWSHIWYVKSFHPYHNWVLEGDFNLIIIIEEKRSGLVGLGPSSDLL